MVYLKILPVLFFIHLLTPFNSLAESMDKDKLIQFVKLFVMNNIDAPSDGKLEISLPDIDPRINIKPCESILKANIPENHNGRNVNVKVYCEDKTPWQLYIPVKVHQKIPVLITQNILAKGTVLDNTNTTVEYINVNRLRGESLDDVSEVSGGRLKRRLSKGAIVSPRNICLVCKGESVTIVAKSNDFMIKTVGIALSDGSNGEQVKIKNAKSGRIINARVTAVNKVIINL